MPQMSPMNWLVLYFMFSFVLSLTFLKVNYLFKQVSVLCKNSAIKGCVSFKFFI